jgi:hypothetical protein
MLTGEKFVWPAIGCGISSYIGVAPLNKISAAISSTGYFPISSFYTKNGIAFAGKRYMRYFDTVYEPKMLWGLENKLDDGLPSFDSGSIRSVRWHGGNACTPDLVALQVATSGADYNYCYVIIYYGETPELPLTPK